MELHLFLFKSFSTNVNQAYLQSKEKLPREIYVNPTKEFELSPKLMLKLLKPIYLLPNRSDCRGRTIHKHLLFGSGVES